MSKMGNLYNDYAVKCGELERCLADIEELKERYNELAQRIKNQDVLYMSISKTPYGLVCNGVFTLIELARGYNPGFSTIVFPIITDRITNINLNDINKQILKGS